MNMINSRLFLSPWWVLLCLLLALVVFATDFLTPLGFAHGNLYFAIVMLSALNRQRRVIVSIATLCIILTLLGFFVSPPGFELRYVIANRALSSLEIGMMAAILCLLVRQLQRMELSHQDLQASRGLISEQSRLLAIAGDALRLGGWILNLENMKVTWSERVRQIHGVPAGYTPTVETAIEFYPPEHRSRVDQAVRLCISEGEPFDQEAELIGSDGQRRWVRLLGQGIRNEKGEIVRIQGAMLDISEDKETQHQLLDLQHRFRQFANAVPQIIWTAEPDGSIDFISSGIESYSGESPETLLQEDWLRLVHPEDTRGCQEYWTRALATGRRYTYQFRLRRQDGEYRWHQSDAQAIFNPQGHVMKWCGSLIDIHEHKTLEDEAQQQRMSLERTLESISDAFITIDRNWCLSYINRAAEQVLECSREQLLGKNVWDQFPNADVFRKQYEHAIKTQSSVEFIEPYQLGDAVKWMEVRAHPTEEGIAVYFRDATERNRQSELLRQAKERFEIVARATTDAVWDWNLATDEVWWNDSIETLFGYPRADLPPDSSPWTEHIHPDDHALVMETIHQAQEGSANHWKQEYRFQRRDGSYAYVSDSGFIIRDEQGKAQRMVGGMQDITESRLLQERLGQSQRLEAIGQLTGGVAHDFNNLLTVIQGNTELLAEDLQDNAALSPLVEMTARAAERAAQLTRHLLAFARRQALEPVAVDVKKLVNGMEELLRRTLMENIHIELVHGGGLWSAMVDTSQLENAILNLCLNARDAMPEGGRLTIETANAFLDQNYADQHIDVNSGQYVCIAVSDTGIGIPDSQLSHVFDPFFTTKASDKGTGLGLSMVYGFVKQSQGHIKIYSEAGQGTTVRMYLPKAKAAVVTMNTPSSVVSGGVESILLVEDDELVRLYAETVLRDLGYHVLAADNAATALEILKANEDIVLLFTDIIMPGGMNGRQLADEALKLRPELKVLFTSGYTENAIVHHGRLDPGVHLISKPYLRRDLASKLRTLLAD